MSRVEEAADTSETVRTALAVAREAHAGQIRNASGGRPYIDHPVAVAETLAAETADEEVLAAALLHDVVEDTQLEVEDLRGLCGSRVAEIVAALTDDSSIQPWAERKLEHRRRVARSGDEALAIYAADKLTNVRMLREAAASEGEAAVEKELKVPLDEKVATWESDLEMLRDHSTGSDAVRSLSVDFEKELSALSEDRSGVRSPD
jgi:(p)ppGpp synthase/HD superfamily hydrolase